MIDKRNIIVNLTKLFFVNFTDYILHTNHF